MNQPFIVMIPARYGASRLPGKPLVDLNGSPMIAHVVDVALASGASRVIVVTDHVGVAKAAEAAGAEALTFTGEYGSGTDRLAAACVMLGIAQEEIVINLQGDEPLMPPEMLARLANDYVEEGCDMGTVAELVERSELHTLSNPNVVKVVTDQHDRALYFSRSLLPFDREQATVKNPLLVELYLRHVGLYAYRASFLHKFAGWGESPLEAMEKLEQLRTLYNGGSISVLTTKALGCVGIDTEADAERVRKIMAEM